jgi:hypothetical protein
MFGRPHLPHTECAANDSVDAAYMYGDKDRKGNCVHVGFDRAVAVRVQCTRPCPHAETVHGVLVYPKSWKFGPNANTKLTRPYVILEATLQVAQVKEMERAAGFGTAANWGKNVKVCVGPETIVCAKEWLQQFVAATPEKRAEQHAYREGVNRRRKADRNLIVRQGAASTKDFNVAIAAVRAAVECTSPMRAAFLSCCAAFADAATFFGCDGSTGLDRDPEDSDCFTGVMHPVRTCLAGCNMRLANLRAEKDFYVVMREYNINVERLCPVTLTAAFASALQRTDEDEDTTLCSAMELMTDERSPGVAAGIDMIFTEIQTKMFNVATERMQTFVRPLDIHAHLHTLADEADEATAKRPRNTC